MSLSISVVTSCFNAESYIEDTIRSILGQQYENLEYIVKDALSTDGTMDIVRKYSSGISQIIEQEDKGQYYGIMQGFEQSSGEIMAWLNADDIYFPWTFSLVNQVFSQYPEVDWIIGLPTFLNDQGQLIKVSSNPVSSFSQKYIKEGWFRGHLGGYLQQESMFWRRSLWEKAGGLDLKLSWAADFELWTRFAQHAALIEVASPLASFRERPGLQRSSQSRDKYELEVEEVCRNKKSPPGFWDAIASRGIVWRSLARLCIWKKTEAIVFSPVSRNWEKKKLRRPISRASLLDLSLERAIR